MDLVFGIRGLDDGVVSMEMEMEIKISWETVRNFLGKLCRRCCPTT
jgi:hypothetical protein